MPAVKVLVLDAQGGVAEHSLAAVDFSGVVQVSQGGTGVTTAGPGLVFASPAVTTGAPGMRALAETDLPDGTFPASTGNYYVDTWDIAGDPDYVVNNYSYAGDYGNGFIRILTSGVADDGVGNMQTWTAGGYAISVYDPDYDDFLWKPFPAGTVITGYIQAIQSAGAYSGTLFTSVCPASQYPYARVRIISGATIDDGSGAMVAFPDHCWAVSDTTHWWPVHSTSNVSTVFGRVGDITAQDDYYLYYSRLGHTHPLVHDTQKADVTWVSSRAQNLVSNGTGLLKNNTNFSAFAFDGSDAYYTMGSFKYAGFSGAPTTDEFLPVDVTQTYRLSLMAKSNPHAVGAHAYFGLELFDADYGLMGAQQYMFQANTLTTLASDLRNGDTVLHLTSAANWNNAAGANSHLRGIIVWNYANSMGYVYPPLTYSRNNWLNIYDDGAISGNNITLRAPWAGGTILAGTQLSNSSSGGTYKYITASNVDVPGTWTPYTGIVGGVDTSGSNITNKFAPGTAFVKIMFLLNRDVAGNTTWITDVTFGLDYLSGFAQPSTLHGVDLHCYTGSSFDFMLLSPGGTSIMSVPTGTLNVNLGGNLGATGAIQANNGAVKSYSSSYLITNVLSYTATAGVVGPLSNHPLEVWSHGTKRVTLDATGMVFADGLCPRVPTTDDTGTERSLVEWFSATSGSVGKITTKGNGTYHQDIVFYTTKLSNAPYEAMRVRGTDGAIIAAAGGFFSGSGSGLTSIPWSALPYTPINHAGDTGITGSLSFDVTVERYVRALGTGINWGLLLTSTQMGLYDITNSRYAFNYTVASNSVLIGMSTTTIALAGVTTVQADLKVQGNVVFDPTYERHMKLVGTNIQWGMYFNTTALGLYDWQNSRNILSYTVGTNAMFLGHDATTLGLGSTTGTTSIYGVTTTVSGIRLYSGASDLVATNPDIRYNASSGNLIISTTGSGVLYFNYDHGTGGVYFCDGAGHGTGIIDANGNATFRTLTSNVATGTAPFTVTSTTPVANLCIGGTAANLAGGNNTTLLGSVCYQSAAGVTTQLAPNVSTTKKFLTQTGSGTNGAAPGWGTIASADLTTALTTPSAIGGTAPAAGAFTTLTGTGALEALGTGTAGGFILKDNLGNRYRMYLQDGSLKQMAL